MRSLWMGVVPGRQMTRVLVQDGARSTLLKARLPNHPKHPRALPTLCEAIALWCGRPVRAAIAVGGSESSCGLTPWLDALDQVVHTPLCEIELVSNVRPRRRSEEIDGLGDFRDVRQLLLFEVAR